MVSIEHLQLADGLARLRHRRAAFPLARERGRDVGPIANGGMHGPASVLVLVPALSISKSANANQVVAGEQVHYSIVLDNTGQVPFLSLSITDPLSGSQTRTVRS